MNESEIQKQVRLEFSKLRRGFLLRYNVGNFLTPDGRYVKIGEPGVSDLVGCVQHTIRQEDVGKTVALFLAVELKQAKGRSSDKQDAFNLTTQPQAPQYLLSGTSGSGLLGSAF